MDQTIIKKIVKRLPSELAEYAVRDVTLLTCSIFGETHFSSFKKIFNVDFSIIFWFVREDGQVVFYRSGAEYALMSQKIGESYLKDIKFASQIANKLIKATDIINLFIKDNNKLNQLVEKWDYFWNFYKDFFAYHQATYWPVEYFGRADLKPEQKKKAQKITKILDMAYKYNEKVIPNVEQYFNNLGIGHLTYLEIDKRVKDNIESKAKNRSALFFNNKMSVLLFSEAKKINQAIEKDYREYLRRIKEIKGLVVSVGVAQGKVRLIKNLSELQNCKKGDILITTQTRPQYNTFIRNVAAIVTDEGGLLCHASMLAREFGIPCIVGTKIATKVLHDGDFVEVDADQGIVKIIK